MLVIVFVFTLSGCNSKDTSSNIDTSTPEQSETFIKPENYASVLLISINPQFKLYLDENNNVLAVEPINKDAKSFSNSIDFENKSIETVIGNIVEQSNENGFIKENVTVDFEIVEKQDGAGDNDILAKAVSATEAKAKELNIEIKTQIKEITEESSSKTETTETSKSTTTKTEETTQPEQSTSTTKPTHTHSYSNATCTTPQKCSCGQTKGSALGHKWQEATCKAPKTCSVCKATEGNIGNHKYISGKCTYCNEKQIINPKNGLKTSGNYYKVSTDDNGNYTLIVYTFQNSFVGVNGVYSTNEEWKESDETISYKGKTYYPVGYGGPLPEYTLTDTEIIVKYSESEPEFAGIEYRLIINYEYDLEVTYSSDSGMFKKGDILDLVE